MQESIKLDRIEDVPATAKIYREQRTDKVLNVLRNGTDQKTTRLRKFAVDSFGSEWTREYLGF